MGSSISSQVTLGYGNFKTKKFKFKSGSIVVCLLDLNAENKDSFSNILIEKQPNRGDSFIFLFKLKPQFEL